jgi:hypothetical protein
MKTPTEQTEAHPTHPPVQIVDLQQLTEQASTLMRDLQLNALCSQDPGIIIAVERELTYLQELSASASRNVTEHYTSMQRRLAPNPIV